jgi:hypothetical protein
MSSRSFALVMLVVAGTLGACGLPKDPEIRVTGVQEREVQGDHRVVVFTLEAKNENSEPVPLITADYSVDAGGQRVFAAARSPEVSVPGKGTQTFTLPAVMPASASGPYNLRGGVTYLWPGRIFELLLDEDYKRPTVQFSGTGLAANP